MKFVNKIEDKISQDIPATVLVKLALVLCIIWLCIQTSSFFAWIFHTFWAIMKPFIIGFTIAYLLKGPIAYSEKLHVNRGIMIAISYICIFLFIGWLISSLVPMFFARSGDFINSLISGINWIMDRYTEFSRHNYDQTWVHALIRVMSDSLKDLSDIIPDISNSLPSLLTNAIGTITTFIFACIISIFMSVEWEKIRFQMFRIASKIHPLCFDCFVAINEEISAYIHSLWILMIIKFMEYACVYLLIGHGDWLLLALLTSISLLVPYIGPTVVNCIGILSCLSMPSGKVVILILLIVILSQVDEYVIAPLVHSRNTAVTPLWVLFSIFASSTLFGAIGVIIAIPSYLAIRMIYIKYNTYREEQKHA